MAKWLFHQVVTPTEKQLEGLKDGEVIDIVHAYNMGGFIGKFHNVFARRLNDAVNKEKIYISVRSHYVQSVIDLETNKEYYEYDLVSPHPFGIPKNMPNRSVIIPVVNQYATGVYHMRFHVRNADKDTKIQFSVSGEHYPVG